MRSCRAQAAPICDLGRDWAARSAIWCRTVYDFLHARPRAQPQKMRTAVSASACAQCMCASAPRECAREYTGLGSFSGSKVAAKFRPRLRACSHWQTHVQTFVRHSLHVATYHVFALEFGSCLPRRRRENAHHHLTPAGSAQHIY